jgi:alanyl-tRNA synthetase
LHQVIGKEARQAGSLVAPDRLRFDFNHPEGLTQGQLNQIENIVNEMIALNVPVTIAHKTLDQAKQEGAMALFGEKYGLDVRTVRIGKDTQLSYELCGGTHVTNTGEIGTFIILSEGSVAAGIRRIEAITGRASYQFISERMSVMRSMSEIFKTTPEKLNERASALNEAFSQALKENKALKAKLAEGSIKDSLQNIQEIAGIPVLAIHLPDIDMNTLREEASKFVNEKKGIALLATTEGGEDPKLVAMLPDELAKRGFHAGKLVNHIAEALGGRGGGKPTMAQAGAKDAANLDKALALVKEWVEAQTK